MNDKLTRYLSADDQRFLNIVRGGVHQLNDGHYEMPLPLKSENMKLPNSKELALSPNETEED